MTKRLRHAKRICEAEPLYHSYTGAGDTWGMNDEISRKYAVMVVVNQACHSGAMMPHLAGDNSILISSAKSTQDSYTEVGGFEHWAFLHEGHHRTILFVTPIIPIPIDTCISGFTPSMGSTSSPQTLFYMFEQAYSAATSNYIDIDGAIVSDYRSYLQLSSELIAKSTYL